MFNKRNLRKSYKALREELKHWKRKAKQARTKHKKKKQQQKNDAIAEMLRTRRLREQDKAVEQHLSRTEDFMLSMCAKSSESSDSGFGAK